MSSIDPKEFFVFVEERVRQSTNDFLPVLLPDLLSQKDFSVSVSSVIGESVPFDPRAPSLTFFTISSLAASHISTVSSIETTPDRESSVRGVKYLSLIHI